MRGNCSGDGKSTEKKVVQSLFIYRFIDKQTIKKQQERKLVYKLFNCFAFVLSCLYYYIWTYNEVTFKITSSWKAFQMFFLVFVVYVFFTHDFIWGALCFLGFCFCYKSRNNICTTWVNWRTITKTVAAVRSVYGNCMRHGMTKREKDRKGYRSK